MKIEEMNKQIISLYEHYKNTPKKLKIVCDWDEVIQACEPYASLLALVEIGEASNNQEDFKKHFEKFWQKKGIKANVEYSLYGSKMIDLSSLIGKEFNEKQAEIKNSPNFYQQAPFLTIAEDLLKLIKEDKIEKLIFLSAYDKRKFPTTDLRKVDIFNETFGKILGEIKPMLGLTEAEMRKKMNQQVKKGIVGTLQLIGFDSETQGANKADWIKEHASDFDIVIDDNPNICRSLAFLLQTANGEIINRDRSKVNVKNLNFDMKIIAPYYPAIESQHHKEVLLVKNEVSDLKKEKFQ